MSACALALMAAALATPALAGDRDFDGVVNRLETQYGVRRTRIPFFGFANFLVKVTRPAGASDIKMAVFEGLPPFEAGPEGDDFVAGTPGPDWHRLIRVRSRARNEAVDVYVKMAGKDMRVLLAVRNPGEAVVMQVKVDERGLLRWLEDPHRMARDRGHSGD